MSVRYSSPVGIVGGELVQVREQRRGLEGVDAGVDLANLLLLRLERLLLDDGLDLRPTPGPCASPVRSLWGSAVRRSESSWPHLLLLMEAHSSRDGLGADQRHVAGEDQHVFVAGDGARAHWRAWPVPRCSACSTNRDAGGGHGCPHLFRLMADDNIDSRRSHDLAAAAITWLSSGLPPISCSTLARRDFSRVPLPAAMITTASFESAPGRRLFACSLLFSPPRLACPRPAVEW